MRQAVTVAAVLCASLLSGVGASAQTAPTPYWQLRGCEHGHPSKLARHQIRVLMHNSTPFTRAEGRRVRHYTYCVATRRKARAGERLVVRLKVWRRSHICTASRGTRELGRCMAARDHGWTGVQFSCLDDLWGGRESGWSVYAHNPTSGAHGIPQALPGYKMGPGWWDNPFVQIRWGLGYIAGRYGTPCGAVAWHNGHNWY